MKTKTYKLRKAKELTLKNGSKDSHHTNAHFHIKFSSGKNKNQENCYFPFFRQIFAFKLLPSADCSTLEPQGYNILRSQTSTGGTSTEEGTSLSDVKSTNSKGLDASLSASAFGVAASIESSYKKSTSIGQKTGKKHKYFYSEAECVDNEASFASGTTPNLHPDFLKKIDNYVIHGPSLGSSDYQEQDEKFAFDFLRNYTFYISWGQLGSRYSVTTTFDEKKLSTFKKKEKHFDIKASVSASFMTAGGGFSEDTQDQKTTDSLNALATRKEHLVGEKSEDGSIVFKRSKDPGLLAARFSPVCDLFPETGPAVMGPFRFVLKNRYNQVKEACYRAASKAICFAHFPDWHDLKGKEKDLKMYLTYMRQYQPCSSSFPPLFGVKPKDRNHLVSHRESFRECLWRAHGMHPTAVSWYYQDGQCHVCTSGEKCLDLERVGSNETVVTGFLGGSKLISQAERTTDRADLLNNRPDGYRKNSFGSLPMLRSDLTENPLPDGSLWLPMNTYPIGDHLETRKKADSWSMKDLQAGCMGRVAWTYMMLGRQPKYTAAGREFWGMTPPITDGKMNYEPHPPHGLEPPGRGEDWFPDKNSAVLHANLFYENRARIDLKEHIKNCSNVCKNTSHCTHVHMKIETPFDKWFIDPVKETVDFEKYQALRLYPTLRPEVTPEDNYCFWWWDDCKHCEDVKFDYVQKKLKDFDYTKGDETECKTDHQAVKLEVTCDFYSFDSVPYLQAFPEGGSLMGDVKDSFVFPV